MGNQEVKARKLVTYHGPLGGTGARKLPWHKVGVYKYNGDKEEEEVVFKLSEITGKAIVVRGHVVSVPEPVRQET